MQLSLVQRVDQRVHSLRSREQLHETISLEIHAVTTQLDLKPEPAFLPSIACPTARSLQKYKVEGEDSRQSKQSCTESQQPYRIVLVKIIAIFIGSKCIS
jgi:hypothetical protein